MRLINIHAHVEGIVSYIIESTEYLSTRQAIMQHYVCAVILRHLGCYVGPCACTCQSDSSHVASESDSDWRR